jgi:S-adenosylmethionine/arginine decarboxylase-like enzyme
MKTKFTADLLTQNLLQWVSCMGSLIQCLMNGAMELLLQLSGISVVVVVTERHLAVLYGCCGTDGWLTAANAVQ